MAVLLAGLGFGLDLTGENIIGLSPSNWGEVGLITFGVFVALTLIREIELYLHPRPKVEFDALSPATNLVQSNQTDNQGGVVIKKGYFTRSSVFYAWLL